jgi:nucleotide-binding universal stress UspA family protein
LEVLSQMISELGVKTMIKHKIVVPLEAPDVSAKILTVVCDLFPPAMAELILCAVVPPAADIVMHRNATRQTPANLAPVAHHNTWAGHRQGLEEQLVQEAKKLRAAGYSVRTRLLTGDTVHEMIRLLEQDNFSLVVMATNGAEGLRRPIFGSSVEQISHLVSVPVLLVRYPDGLMTKEEAVQQPVRLLNAKQPPVIAVATDGSQHTQQAVLLASSIAPLMNATLKVLVTVSERHGAAHDQQVMTSIQSLLHEEAAHADLVPLVGSIDTVIERYLYQHPVDLLVLGAFSDRGASSSTAIGISAQRAAQYAPTPVLVVKERARAIRRILVSLEPGDTSLIDSALQFARKLGAEIHFLHVIPARREATPQRLSGRDVFSHLFTQDTRVGSFLQTVVRTLETWGIDGSALQVWQGDPLRTILNVTNGGNYDLIIVPSHSGPQFFPNTLADVVLRNARTSVLIARRVRPKRSSGQVARRVPSLE